MNDFVAVTVAGQRFGIPVPRVCDIFLPQSLTRVPLAPPEIAGIVNLRGRMVTVIDLRVRLGLERCAGLGRMAVCVSSGPEIYALLVDDVGDVMSLSADAEAPNPANLDPVWLKISRGVYPLDGTLLMVLDIDRLLDAEVRATAAE